MICAALNQDAEQTSCQAVEIPSEPTAWRPYGNPGEAPARFLAIMTPTLYLDYFVELGNEMARARRERGELTDQVRSRISAQLMAKYQTEVVDPIAWERDHPPSE